MRLKGNNSGKYREILEGKKSRVYAENDPRLIPSVRTIWSQNGEDMERQVIELNLGLWNSGALGAKFKDFLFNFVQGRIYLNAALAHFTEERPGCTFCTIIAKRELRERNIGENQPEYEYYLGLVPSENTTHFFWDCEHVQETIQGFYRGLREIPENVFGGPGVDQLGLTRNIYFMGGIRESWGKAKAEMLIMHFIKFHIYQCRLRHDLPSLVGMRREYDFISLCLGNVKKWGKYIARPRDIYE
jgi:hypothetical protein